jgi:hypothetical protein
VGDRVGWGGDGDDRSGRNTVGERVCGRETGARLHGGLSPLIFVGSPPANGSFLSSVSFPKS